MVTDDERREVARRLRDWTWKSSPPECLLNQLAFGNDCPGTDDDPDAIGCDECEVMAAKRLADLIEPPTQCPYYRSDRHYCSIHDVPAIDRDALLALADEMEEFGNLPVKHPGIRVLHNDDFSRELGYARRIREALGVEHG